MITINYMNKKNVDDIKLNKEQPVLRHGYSIIYYTVYVHVLCCTISRGDLTVFD